MNAPAAVSNNSESQTVYLKDYQPPAYLIDQTDLRVELCDGYAEVKAELALRRNPDRKDAGELRLHGEQLELVDIAIDGQALSEADYTVDDKSLTLFSPPEQFTLQTTARIHPDDNTSLEGLYRSRSIYCTQCEAEGFRKITYYLDRPDVMSRFTTTVVADKQRCPVLLSNGNCVEQGDLDAGRHYAIWEDPHKKPSYLFALVAGELTPLRDEFVTQSGKKVALELYVEPKDLDKCDHAMTSLKNAMRWDEEVYGREYDLDIFMIVAVDDFNMGAMENKGLNIFNTACVLANPKTTTDGGFQRVEGVVAHEYFHNWSGNRVTCRDWFQLSLKEGFTVYRDSQFSADMGSPTVKRVEDVSFLRSMQFAEDAGPMAHPIRPASYMEISNFYTLTVYEKGCEVVRMLANLLGPEQFRRATDLYFERHDGEAVTTEDFVQAMSDVSGRDLGQFQRWYNQAGTPTLTVTDEFDENTGRYQLHVRQSTPPTPECQNKKPFHIPVAMGLLGDAGELALKLEGAEDDDAPEDNTHRVIEVTEPEQTFTFLDVPERPVPSLLRGFSAPVKIQYDYSRNALVQLMLHDSDGFNRWEASQTLALGIIDEAMQAYQRGELGSFRVDERFVEAYRSLLADDSLDKAMLALMLRLPGERYIHQQYDIVAVEAIHAARQAVADHLAEALGDTFDRLVADYDHSREYRPVAADIAERSLKNTALGYRMRRPTEADIERCERIFREANNMTDQSAALTALVHCDDPAAEAPAQRALEAFYEKWKDESLVVNQWFSIQASNPKPGALARVEALREHPAFDGGNPNKIRALIGGFCGANLVNFHGALDGDLDAGYRFLADRVIELDAKNPQIAAALIRPLTQWRRFEQDRADAMRAQLERIAAVPGLSPDANEIVTKSL